MSAGWYDSETPAAGKTDPDFKLALKLNERKNITNNVTKVTAPDLVFNVFVPGAFSRW